MAFGWDVPTGATGPATAGRSRDRFPNRLNGAPPRPDWWSHATPRDHHVLRPLRSATRWGMVRGTLTVWLVGIPLSNSRRDRRQARSPTSKRRADVRDRRQQPTLASTNEALPLERPSTDVGAGGGRDRTVDGFAELSKVPSGPRAEHPLLRSAGSTANIRGVGRRPIWSRCRRSAGSRLRSRGATASPKLRGRPSASSRWRCGSCNASGRASWPHEHEKVNRAKRSRDRHVRPGGSSDSKYCAALLSVPRPGRL